MPKYAAADIRNVALCGHGSSGKTTLADKLLNLTGAVTRPASVDDGTSVCDFDEEEKQIGRASCRKECRSRWSPYH